MKKEDKERRKKVGGRRMFYRRRRENEGGGGWLWETQQHSIIWGKKYKKTKHEDGERVTKSLMGVA
jgi:hypothetical protein